ncbi:MAG: hypothetical protein R3272_03265 [Candidatus Promineifilaceae bacterium]|nr:hypothetical protein [Candidatus Promineifilaceae bacterium]
MACCRLSSFPLLLILSVLALLLLGVGCDAVLSEDDSPAARATVISSYLPTFAPTAAATPTDTPTPVASPTPLPSPTPAVPPTRALTEPAALPLDYLNRFGLTGKADALVAAQAAGLPFGSVATWHVHPDPPELAGAVFWQVIRVDQEGVRPPRHWIDATIAANPGAMWLVGNEPDVPVQDNVSPARYAEIYHDLYTHIKRKDPTALIAIGGVSQPTPIRRAYLDAVLDAYETRYGHQMPVDIWNVHAFILREERDVWGVDIPKEMDEALGIPYEIADHDNLAIFQQNIIEFRRWMAERGYADRPLVVSEYGFLMPREYGFTEEEIAAFMTGTFDFFLNARNETGYPADDYRLVQWWFWFIVYADDDEYSASFLYDGEADELTPLGRVYTDYIREHQPAP